MTERLAGHDVQKALDALERLYRKASAPATTPGHPRDDYEAIRAALARPAERPEGHWAPGLRESIQAFLDSWMEPEKPPIAISAFAAEVDRLYRAVYEGGAS